MSLSSDADPHWMAEALRLAERGLYTTSPNPRVGALLVRDGQVVGRGFHARAGEPHAEVHALREAGALARGATLYVTLEPCSHHGRTPPCVEAVLASGVSRVVVATQDANPLVAGRGLAQLTAQGLAVQVGVLEAQARELNRGFFQRMLHQRPWVVSKMACSLDGRTALANGASQWITSPEARRDVQHWRAQSCVIMTGIGTVVADNPRLDVRDLATSRQPAVVILDSTLQLDPAARLARPGVLVATCNPDSDKRARLEAQGVEVCLAQPDAAGRVHLGSLLTELARRGHNQVLVEAGARLNGALWEAGSLDELVVYQAPLMLGEGGAGLLQRHPLNSLDQGLRLDVIDRRAVGPDWRLVVRPRVTA